jgi:hypothetical protein
MEVRRGFTWMSTLAIIRGKADEKEVRRDHFSYSKRLPSDIVMIVSKLGQTDDIRTGTPPKFKQEDKDRWAARREQMAIEKLFRL